MIAPGPQATAQEQQRIPPTGADAPIGEEISHLVGLGREWLQVKRDQGVAKVRSAILTTVTVTLAAFIGAAALATAMAMLLIGTAQVIQSTGLPAGTGNIIIGGGLLVLATIAVLVLKARTRRNWHRARVAEYERTRAAAAARHAQSTTREEIRS